MLILICLAHVIITVLAANVYDCTSDKTIFLERNKIAFYQTTNYPELLPFDEVLKNCSLTFAFFGISEKEVTLFSQYSVVTEEFYKYPTNVTVSNQVFYQINDNYAFDYYYRFPCAQQGFIIFNDGFDDCPLESISRNFPYQFENENKVLFIRSYYYEEQLKRNISCFWQFSAPNGYGFKIVILGLDVASSGTILRISNTTDLIINERNAQPYHPYYNEDIYLNINLTKEDTKNNMIFYAYISIVKKNENFKDGNCNVTIDSPNQIKWTNNGALENNVKCVFNLTIPAFTLAYASAIIALEPNADFVKYYDKNYNGIILYNSVRDKPSLVIQPFDNETQKNVSFEFTSDGNINSISFEIVIFLMPGTGCLCPKEKLKCNDLDSHEFPDYCGHAKCNYTIESCYPNWLWIQIRVEDWPGNDETIKIISEGKTALEIGSLNYNYGFFMAYIYSRKETAMEFNKLPSYQQPTAYFSISSISISNFYKVLVSESFTVEIIEASVNPFVIVKKKNIHPNISIIIYCSDPTNLYLADENHKITSGMPNCFTNASPYKCTVNSSSFYLFFNNNSEKPAVAAIRLSKKPKGCLFDENIFVINEKQTIVGVALNNTECMITIIFHQTQNCDLLHISHMWTSAKANVQIFVGTEHPKLFLEFNYKTVSKWNNLLLLSEVYTIKIPSNGAVLFVFDILWGNVMLNGGTVIDARIYPFEFILASTMYAQNAESIYQTDICSTIFSGDYPVRITALDIENSYSFAPSDNYTTYYESLTLNKIGDFFIIENMAILPYFNSKGFIFFHVQSFNDSIELN